MCAYLSLFWLLFFTAFFFLHKNKSFKRDESYHKWLFMPRCIEKMLKKIADDQNVSLKKYFKINIWFNTQTYTKSNYE